jgi:hypothetical protein
VKMDHVFHVIQDVTQTVIRVTKNSETYMSQTFILFTLQCIKCEIQNLWTSKYSFFQFSLNFLAEKQISMFFSFC